MVHDYPFEEISRYMRYSKNMFTDIIVGNFFVENIRLEWVY